MVDMKLGIYANNKTGNEYVVSGIATDCTNISKGIKYVVYWEFDFPTKTEGYFIRELKEFNSKFTFVRACSNRF